MIMIKLINLKEDLYSKKTLGYKELDLQMLLKRNKLPPNKDKSKVVVNY